MEVVLLSVQIVVHVEDTKTLKLLMEIVDTLDLLQSSKSCNKSSVSIISINVPIMAKMHKL